MRTFDFCIRTRDVCFNLKIPQIYLKNFFSFPQMSPAKASTSSDTMVTASDLAKALPPTENNKKDEAPKKAVEFSLIEELGKSKSCDEKLKIEVRHGFKAKVYFDDAVGHDKVGTSYRSTNPNSPSFAVR